MPSTGPTVHCTKKDRALEILEQASRDGGAVISTQVLAEFYVTVTRKLAVPLGEEEAERVVDSLTKLRIVQHDSGLIRAAIVLSRRYQLSLWDSLILEAARWGMPTSAY